MSSEGDVVAWNAVAERTFGWSAGEAVGQSMAELIVPPQHRESHNRGLKRYNETGEERVLNRRIEITALHKDGRELPVELSITHAPLLGSETFIGFLRDITERRHAEERLKRQARETQLLFEVTRMAAETDSFEEALRSCLEAICQIGGWPIGHAFVLRKGNGSETAFSSIWYEAAPSGGSSLREATEQLRLSPGMGLPGMVLESGEPAWVADVDSDPNFKRKGLGLGSAFAFPVKSEGRIIAILEFFTQNASPPDADLMLIVRTLGEQVGRVLERKRTEEHQRLLLNELNHRVKNTLAVVQAVAAQSFKGANVDAPSRRAFESRLAALAAAHDLLTAENWEAASLREVIEKAGFGCGAAPGRMQAEGPDLRVEPKTAVSFAMAIHELCTNAVKYGALSNDAGIVRVTWTLSGSPDDRELRLRWEESGGPPVAPPRQRGFGTRMIERGLAADLGGSAQLSFEPRGLVCTVAAPLPGDGARDQAL